MSLSEFERLVPFVRRARCWIVGRQALVRSRSRLHFILVTRDASERTVDEILRTFRHYPVVRVLRSEDLERHFQLRGTKVLGFQKGDLAKSLYATLKTHRLNSPDPKPGASESK